MADRYEETLYKINYAIITGVARDGPDVVVTLGNLRPRSALSRLYDLVYNATVRFHDVTRISSVTILNPMVACRLEPGWEGEDHIRFDGLVATMPVRYNDAACHMVIVVVHRIYCDAVTMTRRLSIGQTLRGYFFPRSVHQVCSEPEPSPPIAGQDPPPEPPPPREEIY